MKRALLLMVVSGLLVTLGFGQTPPATAGNTDPANVKGCLDGSDGNYTVREDGSGQTIKITTSSVDLKPHVGHDIKLTGHQGGTVGSGAGDNNFAVTDLSMISEHCAAAAAATVGAVVPYSQTVIDPLTATPPPSAPASTPPVEAAAAVSPSAPVVSTPAVEAGQPAGTVSPLPEAVNTPQVEPAAPVASVSPSTSAVSAPTEKAAHSPQAAIRPRKLSANQAATAPATTVSASPEPEVSPAQADATAASPAPAPVSSSDAAPTTPPVTHKTGSLALLISFVVLVVVLGTMAPLIGRWRKRKMLERTGAQNLSFTNDASPNAVRENEANSDQHKAEPRKVA